MSAIFGFTFHIGRMTEVLTPDIYRAHWAVIAASNLRMFSEHIRHNSACYR